MAMRHRNDLIWALPAPSKVPNLIFYIIFIRVVSMSCGFDCKNAFIRKSPKDLIVTSLIQKRRENIYSDDDVIREKVLEMV